MGKQLYKVSIERSIYVVAKNESEAMYLGLNHEDDENYADPDCIDAQIIRRECDISEEWYPCIPYGNADDLSCGDFFKTFPHEP